MSRRHIPVLLVIVITLALLWQLQEQENPPLDVSEPGGDEQNPLEDQPEDDVPLDEPVVYPEFNIMPVRHGSVKPPLHYNSYFSHIPLETESSTVNGTIERRMAPLLDENGPVILDGELQFREALSIVDAIGDAYILLSDKDQVIYVPVDDSTTLGWNPVDYYDGFEKIFIDGYKFEHSIEGETYAFLRPYWMGNYEKFELIKKARQIINDRIGTEYTRKYFTVAPDHYGYQTYHGLDGSWRYAVMFFYDIQIGDYFQQLEISIYFDEDKEFTSGRRIPPVDNLQPFNVTQIQAIVYGVEAGLPIDAHTYEARILYWKETRKEHTPIQRYVWVIHAWHTEPYTDGASATIAYVDPHTGHVYGLDTVSVGVETPPRAQCNHVKIAVTYLNLAPETTIIPPPPSAKDMEVLVQMGEDDINAYCAENDISYSFDFIPKPVLYTGETPGLEETKELKSDGVDLIVGHDFDAACANSLMYVNYHDMLMLSPISSPLYLRIMDDHLFFFVPHAEAYVFSKMFKELNIDIIVVVGPSASDMYYLFDNLSKSFDEIEGTVYYNVYYRLNELSFDRCLEKTESKVQEALREYDADHVGIAVILWGIEMNTLFFEQVEKYTTLSEVIWFRLWGTPKEILVNGSKEPFCARHACLQIVMKPRHTPKYEIFQQRYRELTNSTMNLYREYDQAARYDAMWLMALSVIEADSCNALTVKTVLPEVAANYVGVIGPCPLDENGDGEMFDYDVMGWLETEPGVYEFIKFGYYDSIEDDFVWYEDYLTLLREKIRN